MEENLIMNIMDPFTINIDVSRDMKTTTLTTIMTLKETDYKIHYINFSEFSLTAEAEKFEWLRNEIGSKIHIVNDVSLCKEWLYAYANKLGKNDLIFINGMDRLLLLVPNYHQKTLVTNIGERDIGSHIESEENWKQLDEFVDAYYNYFQEKIGGIYSVIYTDMLGGKAILELLMHSDNFSILSSESELNIDKLDEVSEVFSHIYSSIPNMLLKQSLQTIEDAETLLGEDNAKVLRVATYSYAGNLDEAINISTTLSEDSDQRSKIQLADLLILRGHSTDEQQAEEILESIYEKNKFARGIFSSFFRLYKNDKDKLYKYIIEALKYDPDNLATIEMNGTMLASLGKNTEAAIEFRRLGSFVDYSYYELVARMNEIIADEKLSDKNIVSYIDEHIEIYPNIKNGAMLRLANYFIKYDENYFWAYRCLNKADLGIENSNLKDIMSLKMNILKDETKAAKAMGRLKLYKGDKVDRNRKRLNTHRYNALIQSITVLSSSPQGYLEWRAFIESQSTKTWLVNVYPNLKITIETLVNNDFNEIINKSYISEIEKIEIEENLMVGLELNKEHLELNKENHEKLNVATIKIARNVYEGGNCKGTFKDFDTLVETILMIPKITKNMNAEIWGTYYLSLIASNNGEGQRSNDLALTIFESANRTDEKTLKRLSQFLGLIAWGNSQYRTGRKVEGITCIIVAINIGIELNEVYPITETGFNIIGKFLNEECNEKMRQDIEFWREVNVKTDKINTFLNFLVAVNTESLEDTIKNTVIKDANWSGHVVNLVASYANDSNNKDAYLTLEKYGNDALKYLQGRQDILFQILYNWSHIYLISLEYGGINSLFKAASLSAAGIEELEKVRDKFSHKEERAGFGDVAVEIYKNHINIYALILEMNHDNNLGVFFKKQLLSVIHNILPRTILEQKHYYLDLEMTDELIELQSKYNKYRLEYDEMIRKGLHDIDTLSQKARAISSLEIKLKENHPHYAPLKKQQPIDFEMISTKLESYELCFQYIITPMGILVIVIETNNVDVYFEKCNASEIHKYISDFSDAVQNDLTKEKLEEMALNISKILGKILLEKLQLGNYSRLYCISDSNGKLFPISAIQGESIHILDCVDSIVNIVDYNILITRPNTSRVTGVLNKVIGNKKDKNILKWIKWSENVELNNFTIDTHSSDTMSYLDGLDIQANTIAIYGHGIWDPNESNTYGAKGIEGEKSIISFEEISKYINKYETLILVSCRSGTPDYDGFDSFYGLWSDIFERFSGNIILCKWDVDTDNTINIIDNIFKSCLNMPVNLDEALLSVQKEMHKQLSLGLWAGIEFWIN